MPDILTVNEDIGIIEVESIGVAEKEDVQASVAAFTAIQAEQGISKVLVDATKQTKMLGVADTYEVFSKLPSKIKIAVYLCSSQPAAEDHKFGEDVAVNRGIRLKVFSDRESALEWLNE